MILLVLRFGPSFYLQGDSESDEDEFEHEEEQAQEEVTEHDAMTERWLAAQSVERDVSSSLRNEEGLSTDHSSSLRSFVAPSFPEALSSEDYVPSHPPSSNLSGSERSRGVRRRRSVHYEPPTFHS